jgi:hypothetical protein
LARYIDLYNIASYGRVKVNLEHFTMSRRNPIFLGYSENEDIKPSVRQSSISSYSQASLLRSNSNKIGRTAQDELNAVNRRIRVKEESRPHAGSLALSTRDTTTVGRTIPGPPWPMSIVLIRELFYFENEMDRMTDIKSIHDRKHVGKLLCY